MEGGREGGREGRGRREGREGGEKDGRLIYSGVVVQWGGWEEGREEG